jgi:hypothetical protein
MSTTLGLLVGKIALDIGAPLVSRIIAGKFGPAGGELAKTVIETVAEKAGVTPDALPDIDRPTLEAAVAATEEQAPELLSLYMAGVDGQFALLQAETREGFWQSFWRYGWMYLLAIFWVWRIIIGPIVNQRLESGGGMPVELVELGVLMTLTSWFMALYMGGHTIKDFGRNVLDAVLKRGGEK